MDTIAELGKFRPQGAARIHPVILCGGVGARLWPLSRARYPKQFHALVSGRSLLEETAARSRADSAFAAPVVIARGEHQFVLEEQLARVGIESERILLEPVSRNTAPAITAAAICLSAVDADAIMLVQPADQVVDPVDNLHRAIARGLAAADDGRLVMFGIEPDRPELGVGYVQVGQRLGYGEDVFTIERFVARPDAERVEQFVESGSFYWNSGIFLFAVRHFLAELERLHPVMLESCRKAVEAGETDRRCLRLDEAAFAQAPELSIDRAIIERTNRAVLVPVDATWHDVSSWRGLHAASAPDEKGNVVLGDVLLDDVHNCYIRSDDRLVAALGLENLVIVATDDAVLVSEAKASERVSQIVAQLHRGKRPESTSHRTTYRPWGYYRSVEMGERFQVKRLVVKPGARLSLQRHHHRSEHWVVVHGTAMVQCGEEHRLLRENESIYIPCGTEHRLENPGKLPLHVIEVQFGAYLGEDDIVRLDDVYGRS
jgi:mannose-1-phosphate guanylyltransferase / mannose-6-phosphate isomerase